jgi:hypothetical protein
MQRHCEEAGRVQTVGFEVCLQGVVIVSSVGAHDTMHVFDRNKGFVHRPTSWARAFSFRTLRMLLCCKLALKDAATMYALIC